jgi:hypothetical protein
MKQRKKKGKKIIKTRDNFYRNKAELPRLESLTTEGKPQKKQRKKEVAEQQTE